jgi:hypothetical protein
MSSVVTLATWSMRHEENSSAAFLEARHDEQRRAAWQAVFEQSQSIEMGSGDLMPTDSLHRRDTSAVEDCSPSMANADRSISANDPAADPIGVGSGSAPWRGGRNPVGTSIVNVDGVAKPGAINPAIARQTVLPNDSGRESQRPDAGPMSRAAARIVPSLATSSLVGESTLVRVVGSKIAIVVRDATIDDEEALQSAFETARELTGARGGLLQLVLNGRALYCQKPIPSQLSLFAC